MNNADISKQNKKTVKFLTHSKVRNSILYGSSPIAKIGWRDYNLPPWCAVGVK